MTRAAAGEAPRSATTARRARTAARASRASGARDLATYRIAVGKRHKVVPGAIVGAIANEGGLHRSDFGHITIRPGLLAGRAAREAVEADTESACEHPDSGSADQPANPTAVRESRATSRNDAVEGRRDPDAQGGLESVAKPERVASLTGIRAVAALLVMATHAAYTTGKYTHGYVGLVYSRMEIGVPIFFVLSGFLLFGPWVQGGCRRAGLRRRCAATPGTGCAASCPPTSSPCWSPIVVYHFRTARPESRPHLDGTVPQPHA